MAYPTPPVGTPNPAVGRGGPWHGGARTRGAGSRRVWPDRWAMTPPTPTPPGRAVGVPADGTRRGVPHAYIALYPVVSLLSIYAPLEEGWLHDETASLSGRVSGYGDKPRGDQASGSQWILMGLRRDWAVCVSIGTRNVPVIGTRNVPGQRAGSEVVMTAPVRTPASRRLLGSRGGGSPSRVRRGGASGSCCP